MTNEMVTYASSGDLIERANSGDLVTKSFEMLAAFTQKIAEQLIDGVDYGLIPGTPIPSLFQSGAEKIKLALGLSVEYIEEKSIENYCDEPFFLYRFKCCAYKDNYLVATGLGTCNTKEKKYIKDSPFDKQETVLLMAKKRAFVSCIREAANLSGMFTQDLVDDVNSTPNKLRVDKTSDGKISKLQIQRLYAIKGIRSLTDEELNSIIKEFGYDSAKDIIKKDYAEICNRVEKFKED